MPARTPPAPPLLNPVIGLWRDGVHLKLAFDRETLAGTPEIGTSGGLDDRIRRRESEFLLSDIRSHIRVVRRDRRIIASAGEAARPARPRAGGRAIIFETIRYEVDDGVARIELNRPHRLNAINSVMSRELPEMWRRFDADPDAIVAVVTGAGDKAFCTGADLADLPEMLLDEQGAPSIASIRWTPLQNQVWKPVICAINGAVMGGGLHFVAECDIVLASESATFCDPHVSVGLVSGLETIALARRMPMGPVLRMALAGRDETITAREAQALGMVGELCAPDALMPRAQALAARIRRNSPSAMARTKRAIWSAKETGLTQASLDAWTVMMRHNQTHDFAEGVRAFTEKRAPRWAPYSGVEPNEAGQ